MLGSDPVQATYGNVDEAVGTRLIVVRDYIYLGMYQKGLGTRE